MRTLIVTAHPDEDSLTNRAAARLRELLGPDGTTVADLAREGFDPRFTPVDRRAYQGQGGVDPSVVVEQARVDAVEHLVLVFPVYWWSMPALLKGWIDRVFIAGWAFGDDGGRVVPRLGRLTAHLLPVSGTSAQSFEKHGYTRSFSTQIESGILDYCGMQRGVTAFLHDSESPDRHVVEAGLTAATAAIADSILGARPLP
jgi:NAD(P)H dehydrogenase (quinone)